jgi:hypothetical protein
LTQILISKKFEKKIVFKSSVLAWIRIRIRIEKKCWIRIRKKSIRIHNPGTNAYRSLSVMEFSEPQLSLSEPSSWLPPPPLVTPPALPPPAVLALGVPRLPPPTVFSSSVLAAVFAAAAVAAAVPPTRR